MLMVAVQNHNCNIRQNIVYHWHQAMHYNIILCIVLALEILVLFFSDVYWFLWFLGSQLFFLALMVSLVQLSEKIMLMSLYPVGYCICYAENKIRKHAARHSKFFCILQVMQKNRVLKILLWDFLFPLWDCWWRNMVESTPNSWVKV